MTKLPSRGASFETMKQPGNRSLSLCFFSATSEKVKEYLHLVPGT